MSAKKAGLDRQAGTNPYTDGTYLAAALRYAETLSPEVPSAIWVCVLPGEVQVCSIFPLPEDEKERDAVNAALRLGGVLAAFGVGNEEALSSNGGCFEIIGSAREALTGAVLLMGQVNGRERFEAGDLTEGIRLTFPASGGIEAESAYDGPFYDPAAIALLSRAADTRVSVISTAEESGVELP